MPTASVPQQDVLWDIRVKNEAAMQTEKSQNSPGSERLHGSDLASVLGLAGLDRS